MCFVEYHNNGDDDDDMANKIFNYCLMWIIAT